MPLCKSACLTLITCTRIFSEYHRLAIGRWVRFFLKGALWLRIPQPLYFYQEDRNGLFILILYLRLLLSNLLWLLYADAKKTYHSLLMNSSAWVLNQSHSLLPHGLGPTRLLCPWDVPGKNTGVLLPGIFLTQELNLLSCIIHWLFTTESLGKSSESQSLLLDIMYFVFNV